jgi:hypothetical protein
LLRNIEKRKEIPYSISWLQEEKQSIASHEGQNQAGLR